MASSSSQDGWVDILIKEQDQQICYGLFSTSDGDWPAGDLFVGGEQLIYGPSEILPNTWTHLATTYDGTTQNLYVNGALVASRPQAGAVVTAPNPLHIGGDSIWGEYFSGIIDEVRIYNRALSQAEIQSDMTPILVTQAAAPSFSPDGGTYTGPQTVTLETATTGASIRYTTDGTTASDTAGTVYTGPIALSGTTTVQAIAYADGLTNSLVSAATYTIQ